MKNFLDTLKWKLIDTFIMEKCSHCEQYFSLRESARWPSLYTVFGTTYKVCPECFKREYSWNKEGE